MARSNEKGSFVRWQGIAISQLGYAVNLTLSLAVASLGFMMALLLNHEFTPLTWQKYTFSAALVSSVVSIALGVYCVINRLRDFRLTKDVAHGRESGLSNAKLQPLRELADALGKRTWQLFWYQIGTFAAGVVLMTIAVAGSLAGKLF